MIWRRRRREPVDDLDPELADLRKEHDGTALDGLRLVRKRLGSNV